LSGGNQQRLLLSLIPAQAKLLLMENPTRGLDVGSAAQVWEYLVERCRQGASLLYFSADLDEILAYSQRVLVFYNRSIVADITRDKASMQVLGEWMAGGREAA
jgi:simple sugar transport system ATP-binding protein